MMKKMMLSFLLGLTLLAGVAGAQQTDGGPVGQLPPIPLLPPPPPLMGMPPLETPSSVAPNEVKPFTPVLQAPVDYPSAVMPMATAGVGQNRMVDQASAQVIRHVFRGVMAARSLLQTPHHDGLLRKVLDLPLQCTTLLKLDRFPTLPRFQARADENVLRDRSFQTFQYRKFGSFQTKLDGWLKPSMLEVNVDLLFHARGQTRCGIKGIVTREGALTGGFIMEGADGFGRPWHLKCEFSNVLVRDDGFPALGRMQISGSDPNHQTVYYIVEFPAQISSGPEKSSKILVHPSPVRPPEKRLDR
jgi:hypothetical protein